MKKIFLLSALVISFGLGYGFSKITSVQNACSNKKATGIGGIFFKCKDPQKVRE